MNYRTACLFALLAMNVSGDATAGKTISPFAGSYADTPYFSTFILHVSDTGSVTGYWTDYWGSGRITDDGVLTMTLKYNGKRFTERLKLVGQMSLNEFGDLEGVVQIENWGTFEVVLGRLD